MTTKSPKEKPAERAPVIAVMGHIDHGKSTLLDYIRKTNVVEKEAGGITQHISAYEVIHETKDHAKKSITFLDTPGHAAFQAMRSRGATVADIAVLVVSAEDGVKPQTIEARRAIEEAKIPYVVAITKIDKPNANSERAKSSLIENEIYVEGYGGDIPIVELSAKSGVGVPELLDMLLLVAELQGLTGDSSKPGEGIVIESSLDKKKGTGATLIIKDGSLEQGMFVVAGGSVAPVRIMEDFLGKPIKKAGFSSPVRIIGFDVLPPVGTWFKAVTTKKEAEVLAQEEQTKEPMRAGAREVPEDGIAIPIIVKADVLGSLEAVIGELMKLETEKVKIDIVQRGVGAITENDVKLASASANTIILGFNVKLEPGARDLGERMNVPIELFDIIYKLSERLTVIVEERTPRNEVEVVKGTLKVLKTFSTVGRKQVLGGRVITGAISVHDQVRIMRRELEIGRGKIVNLQQSKMDTNSVTEEGECGMQIQLKSGEAAPGDMIESVTREIR